MKKFIIYIFIIPFVMMAFLSCEKDDPAPPPTVRISAEASENDVFTYYFKASVENASAYAWDFGDGRTSSELNPEHTYEQSGTYEVTLTVTGDGGEASASMEVVITTRMDFLTGGPDNEDGKTWVLSTKASTGDGAGIIRTNFPNNILKFPDNVLAAFGAQAEYDNEYTFKHDGTYQVNNVNGNFLSGWLYALNELGQSKIVATSSYGIFVVKEENPDNTTWEWQTGDFEIDATNEVTPGEIVHEKIIFEDVDYLTFTNGGFMGILDYVSTVLIREISKDKLVLSMFQHTNQDFPDKPSLCITMTFVPK